MWWQYSNVWAASEAAQIRVGLLMGKGAKVANTGFHIIYPFTYDENHYVGINSIVPCNVNISMILMSQQKYIMFIL